LQYGATNIAICCLLEMLKN